MKFLTVRKIVFLICYLSIGTMAAQTDSVSASAPWTLHRCISYALEHSLQLKQKQVAVAQADADVELRQGALFPSLNFATNQGVTWRPWAEEYVNITGGTMTTSQSQVNYNGTYGLAANWTLWNGGRNRKQLERSRLARRQSSIDVESTSLTLQEQIVQIYVQILYQSEAVRVNSEIEASTLMLLDRARQRYDVGDLSRADLAQMEAQAAQETYNVANARTQLNTFKLQLRQLLELPANIPFTVATPTISNEEVTTVLPAAADVFADALALRPEIQYSKMGVELADMDINIARRGYYPTIGISAGVNTSNMSGVDKSFGTQLKTNLTSNLGVSLNVPIFDNRQNSVNVTKARLDRETALLNLEQQQKDLSDNIETIWLNANNAQEQYRAALASVEGMRQSYTLVSEQFKLGLKDIVDLTTGKNNLIQAEQQMLQAKYTAVLNRALLQFYQGHALSL